MSDAMLEIEVAYATPKQQKIIILEVDNKTTVEQAIDASKIADLFPQQDFKTAQVGLFGKNCSRDTVLQQGDRIEIYRPLLCDPKQARRNRAINP